MAAALGQHGAVDHGIERVLLIICAVADGDALGLVLVPVVRLSHACVEQKMLTARKLDRTAGKASVLVIRRVGRQGCGQIVPVNEIPGLHMAPVHGAPGDIIGVVLEKQMILALVKGEAVGVVDPADAARHMEIRQQVPGLFPLLPLVFTRLAQHFTLHISLSNPYSDFFQIICILGVFPSMMGSVTPAYMSAAPESRSAGISALQP